MILALMAAVAVSAAMTSRYLFPEESLEQIASRAEWENALRNRHCILFVDGAWNVDVVAFRRPFCEFASWCRHHSTARAMSISIDPDDTSNDAWKICDELWQMHRIPRGGLKNYGGAGRIVWIRNGTVVDYVWCMELAQGEEPETIAELIRRTNHVFGN